MSVINKPLHRPLQSYPSLPLPLSQGPPSASNPPNPKPSHIHHSLPLIQHTQSLTNNRFPNHPTNPHQPQRSGDTLSSSPQFNSPEIHPHHSMHPTFQNHHQPIILTNSKMQNDSMVSSKRSNNSSSQPRALSQIRILQPQPQPQLQLPLNTSDDVHHFVTKLNKSSELLGEIQQLINSSHAIPESVQNNNGPKGSMAEDDENRIVIPRKHPDPTDDFNRLFMDNQSQKEHDVLNEESREFLNQYEA